MIAARYLQRYPQDVAALVKHASIELAAMGGVKRWPSVALGEPS